MSRVTADIPLFAISVQCEHTAQLQAGYTMESVGLFSGQHTCKGHIFSLLSHELQSLADSLGSKGREAGTVSNHPHLIIYAPVIALTHTSMTNRPHSPSQSADVCSWLAAVAAPAGASGNYRRRGTSLTSACCVCSGCDRCAS